MFRTGWVRACMVAELSQHWQWKDWRQNTNWASQRHTFEKDKRWDQLVELFFSAFSYEPEYYLGSCVVPSFLHIVRTFFGLAVSVRLHGARSWQRVRFRAETVSCCHPCILRWPPPCPEWILSSAEWCNADPLRNVQNPGQMTVSFMSDPKGGVEVFRRKCVYWPSFG